MSVIIADLCLRKSGDKELCLSPKAGYFGCPELSCSFVLLRRRTGIDERDQVDNADVNMIADAALHYLTLGQLGCRVWEVVVKLCSCALSVGSEILQAATPWSLNQSLPLTAFAAVSCLLRSDLP